MVQGLFALSLEKEIGGKGMTWEDYLKKPTDEDITDWETAVKEFIKKGKELVIPL